MISQELPAVAIANLAPHLAPLLPEEQITRPSNREATYEAIVDDIRQMYHYKLSDQEAHTAARNLIEFVKISLKVAEREIIAGNYSNNKIN